MDVTSPDAYEIAREIEARGGSASESRCCAPVFRRQPKHRVN